MNDLIYSIKIMCGGRCGWSIWEKEWVNIDEPMDYINFPGSEFIDEAYKPSENEYHLKHINASSDYLCDICKFKRDILETILEKLQVLVQSSDTYLLQRLVEEIKKDHGPYSPDPKIVLEHYNEIFNKWINNYNEKNEVVQRSQLRSFRKGFFNLYEQQVSKN